MTELHPNQELLRDEAIIVDIQERMHDVTSQEMPLIEAVGVGSVVELWYAGDPEDDTTFIQIVGYHGQGKTRADIHSLAHETSLAKEMLGKREGDVVKVQAPNGSPLIVTIRSIHGS